MRSDYALYIVALICFIIAGIFLTGAVQGYTFADSMGMVSITVFLILGIIFGLAGYATKPKITTQPPITEPAPALAEPAAMPMSPPTPTEEVMPEPQPEPEPVVEQAPREEAPQTVSVDAPEVTSTSAEVMTPVPPPPPPLASVEEEIAKTPEEKPAPTRRRRRKKTE